MLPFLLSISFDTSSFSRSCFTKFKSLSVFTTSSTDIFPPATSKMTFLCSFQPREGKWKGLVNNLNVSSSAISFICLL